MLTNFDKCDDRMVLHLLHFKYKKKSLVYISECADETLVYIRK